MVAVRYRAVALLAATVVAYSVVVMLLHGHLPDHPHPGRQGRPSPAFDGAHSTAGTRTPIARPASHQTPVDEPAAAQGRGENHAPARPSNATIGGGTRGGARAALYALTEADDDDSVAPDEAGVPDTASPAQPGDASGASGSIPSAQGSGTAVLVPATAGHWSCDPEARSKQKRLVVTTFYRGASATLAQVMNSLADAHGHRLVAYRHKHNSMQVAKKPERLQGFTQAIAHGVYKVPAFHNGSSVAQTGVSGTGRVAFMGNLAFMDFHTKGFKQPIYVTFLRHPLFRAASVFAASLKDPRRKATMCRALTPDSTLSQCLDLVRDGVCPRHGCGSLNQMTKQLCGTKPACAHGSSHFARKQAMIHMQYRYDFVGILEEPELSMQMLETVLPRWFAHADHLLTLQPQLNRRPKGPGRPSSPGEILQLSTENRELLKQLHRNDMKLYRAALSRLKSRASQCTAEVRART